MIFGNKIGKWIILAAQFIAQSWRITWLNAKDFLRYYHAIVKRRKFQSKHFQNISNSDCFWKWICEELHTVAVRSRFVKSVNALEVRIIFDELMAVWNQKSAWRCVAKHIWKSKVLKTAGVEVCLKWKILYCWQIHVDWKNWGGVILNNKNW